MKPRNDFIQEVKKYKKKYGSLKKFLSDPEQNGSNIDPAQIAASHSRDCDFLGNPIINSYLSRNSDEITFKDDHPLLDDTKANKETNDYYEMKIYRLMGFFKDYNRDNSDNKKFYENGALPSFASHAFINEDNAFINSVIDQLNEQHEKNGIFISHENNSESIRDLLDAMAHPEYASFLWDYFPELYQRKLSQTTNVKFILSTSGYHSHASILFSIMNPTNNKILASIFINSWQNDDYTKKYIEGRLNYKGPPGGNGSYIIDEETKVATIDYVKHQFRDSILKEPFLIDKTNNKIAYSFNKPPLSSFDIFKANNIDLVFQLDDDFKNGCPNVLYIINDIPFMEASHKLQVMKDDKNCALYAFNFRNAIVNMLTDPAYANRIYQLAEKFNSGDEVAKKELKNIFCEELKSYLPCYYEKDNTAKPYDEIKRHHLKQRWDIGSQALKMDFPATQPSTKFTI